uniref:Zinc finger, CCHC-type n=1 Tax=Tanacetum cinerariifolium TaxID=118510 RepID=A0A6L2LGU7_TANCI|nr:zinc finger, CCHC-type [Tanacetum cinerariifolium]
MIGLLGDEIGSPTATIKSVPESSASAVENTKLEDRKRWWNMGLNATADGKLVVLLLSCIAFIRWVDHWEQYNELPGILGRFTQYKINMDEAIKVCYIIDKLSLSWKDFKHTLKHKEELTLVELGSHLRIEESLRVHDSDKPKSNNVVGPLVVNVIKHNNSSRYNDNKRKLKHHDNTRPTPNKKEKPSCWKYGKTGHIKRDCKSVNVGNKGNGSGIKGLMDGSSNSLKGIECIFVGYVEHSKAFRLFVIEPSESILINYIIESKDAIFDENRFSSVPRPSQRSLNVAFWKEAINDVVDSIMGNNTWVLDDLPSCCKPLGYKWIFRRKLKMDVKTDFLNGKPEEEVYMNQPQAFIMPGNENKVDLIKKCLSSRFFIKDMGEADVILVSTPMDTSEKLMPNNGQVVSQLENYRVIGCLMYAMTCTRPDIAFVMGKLSRHVYALTMTLDQLQNQLDKDEFQKDKSMDAFWVLNNQFQKFIDWQYFLDYDSEKTEKLFAEYTGIKVKQFKETLLLRMECGGTKSDEHITSSCSGTYITHVVDADIRLHTDQFEPSYDTHLLEKVDSNITLNSTNMCHNGGEIDQDAEQDQVKSSFLKSHLRIAWGHLAGRVILFGTIPTTIPDTIPVIALPTTQTDTTGIPTETPIISPIIPPSLNYTPASPYYSPSSEIESDPSEDPSSDHIPPLPAVLPFLSSDDDTTDSDTPDTPPLPTHGTPFIEITASTQRSPVIPRRQVMILAPGQPILHGRPYRYHPNGPVHMMTARKRVRPLPVQHLSVRHYVDHSSSDSSSRHSLLDRSSPGLPSTFAGPSRKRRRSPMTSVPALPLVSGALSPVCADLIPSPKRVRDIGYLADVKVSPRETKVERVMHPVMLEDIPEPAQEGAAEVTYETLGDLVQRFHDHTQATLVHRIQAIEGIQREEGHRTIGVELVVTALIERVAKLERDNKRLRGTTSVESQRVDRLQRGILRMQREMRQMRRF